MVHVLRLDAVDENLARIQSLTYDANGNLLSDGTRIRGGRAESADRYDGLERFKRIVEKEDTVVNDEQLIWCGGEICEEHDEGRWRITGGTSLVPFQTLTTELNRCFWRDDLATRHIAGRKSRSTAPQGWPFCAAE